MASGTSSAQDGLWFQQRLAPGAAYQMSRVYRVTGELDVPALHAAWRAVLGWHDGLRTTFVERDGWLVPQVAELDAELAQVDLSSVRAADRDTAVDRWCAELAATPLPPTGGPLASLTVARCGPGEHAILLVLHRMIADENSLSLLLDDLSTAYSAALNGQPVLDVRPRAGSSYREYVRWQQELRTGAEFADLVGWWVSALTPVPPPLDLPVDRARPAGPAYTGGAVRFEWDGDLPRLLAELAGTEATTPSAVLLAGFQALLGRYGGTDRIPVGTPVTVRPGPAFDRAVGMFGNIVVLCADLSGRPTFRELVNRVAAQRSGALARRELPFETLVHELELAPDPYRIPLCDAMFACRDTPESELVLPGAVVRPQHLHNGTVQADLTLSMHGVGPTVAGSLEYRDCLFDRSSAQRMLGQLHTVLVTALRQPELPVDELPIDPPERIRALVRSADLVTAHVPVGRPAHELVHLRALDGPNRTAVSWEGTAISYAELERQAAAVTAALAGQPGGVTGLPVAVRMGTGPGQVAALLGVLDAGGHLVCLGPGDAGERGKAVLAEVRPACLLLDGDPAEDRLAGWYADELSGRVISLGARAPGVGALPPAPVPGELTDRAYLAYTSGSTGRPKGIPQSHGTLAQFVTWFADEFGIRPGSQVAQWAAPGYDAALCEVFAALVAGATLCPLPDRIRANPEKVVDWLAAEQITVFQTVPGFAKEILRVVGSRGAAGLDSLDHLLLAGEALPGELANGLRAALPGARLVNLYGPTESILATWQEITDAVHGTAPIGRSIPGRQVLVVDERDRPCPAGVTGTIVVRGPHVTPGYVGAAAGERSAFVALRAHEELGPVTGRCYRTGDRGRTRWDGSLEFRGRSDFQIKFNGVRVELTDIEAALSAHESVAECALVALRDRHGLVARVVAYVVPVRGPSGKPLAAADTWRAVLRQRFGRSMLPVSFMTMIGLPRNLGGKVDRRKLPAPGPAAASPSRPPRRWVERALAELWADLLGAEPADLDENFFAAGGSSLLALRLVSRIRERFGAEVPLRSYLADPTLSGLSALVESQCDVRKPLQHYDGVKK